MREERQLFVCGMRRNLDEAWVPIPSLQHQVVCLCRGEKLLKTVSSRAQWSVSVIPAFGRLSQEDFEFKVRLGYMVRIHFRDETNQVW